MKKFILPAALFAVIGFSSCGGEMSLCDCMDLKDKYESKKEAEEALGEEKVKKCMDLMKDAKEEDIKKCEK